MRISFVLPVLSLAGGIRIVAVYADWLARHGHEVTVVAQPPRSLTLREKLRTALRKGHWPSGHLETTYFRNSAARLTILDEHRPITNDDVPDGDVVIATWWRTAEFVRDLNAAKGQKVYFLQHYEIHENLPVERVRETWRFPFKKIVVSTWLKDIAAREFGDRSAVVVPNGVDLAQFRAEPRRRQTLPTVGMLYSSTPYKGTQVAIRAVELARKRRPDLRLLAFGASKPTRNLPLPPHAAFHLRPPQNQLREIYSGCDAWLFASRTEGFGLPILEAMACRTPVIGTPAGAAPDLLAEGRGILVPYQNPEAMADAILEILSMPEGDWSLLSQAAYSEASRHGIEEACRRFENAVSELGAGN